MVCHATPAAPPGGSDNDVYLVSQRDENMAVMMTDVKFHVGPISFVV